MNDEKESQSFFSLEKRRKQIYLLVLMFIFIRDIITSFIYAPKLNTFYIILFPCNVVMTCAMIQAYRSLRALMKEHHMERYLEIRMSMTFFFIAEIIPMIMFVIMKHLLIINGVDNAIITDQGTIDIQMVHNIIWTIYPLFQAYGMLRLKDS